MTLLDGPPCLLRHRGGRRRAALVASCHRHACGRGHFRLLDGARRARRRDRGPLRRLAAGNLAGYTGMLNLETIGGRIIEAHLRFADQWPDLYGPGWVEALVGLYERGVWDSTTSIGARAIASSCSGRTDAYRHPPAELVDAVRSMPDVTSVQITFHEDRDAEATRCRPAASASPSSTALDLAMAEAGRAAPQLIFLAPDRAANGLRRRWISGIAVAIVRPPEPRTETKAEPKREPSRQERRQDSRGSKHENRCVRRAGWPASRRGRGRSGGRPASCRRQRFRPISATGCQEQWRHQSAGRHRQARAGFGPPAARRTEVCPPGRPSRQDRLPWLNYLEHVKEGSQRDNIPKFPTIFFRGLTSLVPHGEPIIRPRVSETLDYEAEMILVVGRRAKHLTPANATSCIAGYSCGNEGSIREFQRKTTQWDMGKNFDRTGGFGPWLVTADELPDAGKGLKIECRLNGTVMQSDNTDNMMFPVVEMLVYVTQGITLEPGDVIFTGTPSGVGHARKPPVWMKQGDVCEVEIEGIGVLRNPIADEVAWIVTGRRVMPRPDKIARAYLPSRFLPPRRSFAARRRRAPHSRLPRGLRSRSGSASALPFCRFTSVRISSSSRNTPRKLISMSSRASSGSTAPARCRRRSTTATSRSRRSARPRCSPPGSGRRGGKFSSCPVFRPCRCHFSPISPACSRWPISSRPTASRCRPRHHRRSICCGCWQRRTSATPTSSTARSWNFLTPRQSRR